MSQKGPNKNFGRIEDNPYYPLSDGPEATELKSVAIDIRDNRKDSKDLQPDENPSKKTLAFLEERNITLEEIKDRNISIRRLNQLVQQPLKAQIISWLSLEEPFQILRALIHKCLDKRGIKDEAKRAEVEKGCCEALHALNKGQMWIGKGVNTIPLKSETHKAEVYATTGLMDGSSTTFSVLAEGTTLSLLVYDVIIYIMYPDFRFDTTIGTILAQQADNTQSVISTIPLIGWLWRSYVLLSVLIGIYYGQDGWLTANASQIDNWERTLRVHMRSRQISLGLDEEYDFHEWDLETKELESLYKKNWSDFREGLRRVLPNSENYALFYIERELKTNENLAPKIRWRLFKVLEDIAEHARYPLDIQAISAMAQLAFGVKLKNLDYVEQGDRAIKVLEHHANKNTSYYRYLYANYKLWLKTPTPQLKWRLSLLFLMVAGIPAYLAWKSYATYISGVAEAIRLAELQKACEDSGSLWRIINRRPQCTFCDETKLAITAEAARKPETCLESASAQRQEKTAFLDLLRRLPTSTTRVSLANQDLSDLVFLEEALNFLARMPNLEEVDFSSVRLPMGPNGGQLVADFIRQAKSPKLRVIKLDSQKLGKGIGPIADALATRSSLEELSLFNNELDADDAARLNAGLRALPNLDKVDLRTNRFGTRGTVNFADTIAILGEVDLSNNRIGLDGDTDVEKVGAAVRSSKKLKKASFKLNDITDSWMTTFSNGFNTGSGNTALQYISFESNWDGFGDQAAIALANSVIKYSPDLRQVLLADNHIQDAGSQAVMGAIHDPIEVVGLGHNFIGPNGVSNITLPDSLQEWHLTSNRRLGSDGSNNVAKAAAKLKAPRKAQRLVLFLDGCNIDPSGLKSFGKLQIGNVTLTLANNQDIAGGIRDLASVLDKLEKLVITNTGISADDLKELLKNGFKGVVTFIADDNNLGDTGAQYIADAIRQPNRLRVLLKINQRNRLKNLQLVRIGMGPTGSDALGSAVEQSGVESLTVNGNLIQIKNGKGIGNALKQVRDFSCTYCGLDGEDIEALVTSLSQSKSIRLVDISDNPGGDRALIAIADALKQGSPVEDFSAVRIGGTDEGGVKFARAIPGSNVLRADLRENAFGRGDANGNTTPQTFAEVLLSGNYNPSTLVQLIRMSNGLQAISTAQRTALLTTLNLMGNEITTEGAQLLCAIAGRAGLSMDPRNGLNLHGNPGIDPQRLNVETCQPFNPFDTAATVASLGVTQLAAFLNQTPLDPPPTLTSTTPSTKPFPYMSLAVLGCYVSVVAFLIYKLMCRTEGHMFRLVGSSRPHVVTVNLSSSETEAKNDTAPTPTPPSTPEYK